MVLNFKKENKVPENEIKLTQELVIKWIEYHKKNAEYRWRSKEENRRDNPKRKRTLSDSSDSTLATTSVNADSIHPIKKPKP